MQPHLTALRSLFLIARHHGCSLSPEQLAAADQQDTLTAVRRLIRAAGMRDRVLTRRKWPDLLALGSACPVMAIQKNGSWVVLVGVLNEASGPMVVLLDPASERTGLATVPPAEFLGHWSGTLVLAKPIRGAGTDEPAFGLRWFLPELQRNRRYFTDVALAAIASNVVGLSVPLLYHVVIDKVLPHQSMSTMFAVLAIFLLATAFDGVFSYVRQRMMLFATNKIDANLASRTFQRLLELPMPFFEHTPAGVLVRNMQQTEKLRQFLTGRLFQVLLDAATMPMLIVLLVAYSFQLTVLVFGFALAMAGVIFIILPAFKAALARLYAAEGARQSHLVETVQGVRTVKSLAMEPLRQQGWDSKVVAAVRGHAAVQRIAAMANVLTSSLDKLMQITVLSVGVTEVFTGNMTVGALVAFTMLASRVSGPLVQIVGLINEYQETALSVRMLATVMDHPPERSRRQRGGFPPITGELEFEQVSFRYQGASRSALDRVSFRVAEGQMVGVVGRSGSGKTTVTRLIQGIQAYEEGTIRISGVDLRQIDLGHLRRHIGVVLQDSFLFHGTIRENIAAARPDALLHDIVAAAQLAGAEEFIERLPAAYDTMLEEAASNLSGGQRQRLAIARALLMHPPLLIFDEATSALDPDSEAILQSNLKEIGRGRSMIVVSHRLSSLVQADSILVLENGEALDFAPHPVLLERCAVYRHLWQQQTRHMQP